MGIPDPPTCLLRNLYAGQEAIVRTEHRTTDWSESGKEYVEAVYCHPAYLTYMQSTSLCICTSFVKDKVSICAWIYLWAFYFVPLIYISVFVPVPYCLDDCGFVVEPEVR